VIYSPDLSGMAIISLDYSGSKISDYLSSNLPGALLNKGGNALQIPGRAFQNPRLQQILTVVLYLIGSSRVGHTN
jgi:hypothetical protein